MFLRCGLGFWSLLFRSLSLLFWLCRFGLFFMLGGFGLFLLRWLGLFFMLRWFGLFFMLRWLGVLLVMLVLRRCRCRVAENKKQGRRADHFEYLHDIVSVSPNPA